MSPATPGRIDGGRRTHSIRKDSGGGRPGAFASAIAATTRIVTATSRVLRRIAIALEDFGQLQRLWLLAPVAAPEVLGQPLAEDRERDRDVGEAHDVGAAVRFLAPGDALGRQGGAAEPAEDRVVGRDL